MRKKWIKKGIEEISRTYSTNENNLEPFFKYIIEYIEKVEERARSLKDGFKITMKSGRIYTFEKDFDDEEAERIMNYISADGTYNSMYSGCIRFTEDLILDPTDIESIQRYKVWLSI